MSHEFMPVGLHCLDRLGLFHSKVFRLKTVYDLNAIICEGEKRPTRYVLVQEAQLPPRDSASAAHVFLGSLTDRALHCAPDLFYNYIID